MKPITYSEGSHMNLMFIQHIIISSFLFCVSLAYTPIVSALGTQPGYIEC